jgi:hypothetical protein
MDLDAILCVIGDFSFFGILRFAPICELNIYSVGMYLVFLP